MPVLQLDDQQFPLKAGVTRIGAGADADVVVPGYSTVPVEAMIDGGKSPSIRRANEEAHVLVNGVLLGAEPTPLVHGDKVEIAGLELIYADDAKGGATQFVSASEIAALTGAKRAGAARATSASGGRVVSLVDGKEYTVPGGGLVFGRDAACDVVVPQAEVSRRHAEIQPAENGYIVKDTSANGIYVNGTRVEGTHLLSRSDVLRIGGEEFRFYADVIPAKPTPPTAPAVPPKAPVAPVVPVPEPVLVADASQSLDTFGGLDLITPTHTPIVPAAPVAAAPPPPPAAPPAPPKAAMPPSPAPAAPTAPSPRQEDPRPVLAVLEALNEGPTKGKKYELRTPLAHIGRGAHNDVPLNDESVSDSHAKLQRRDDAWYVVDMDSTNGTYVGGSRISGEKRIDGSPDVRFGGLKFRFTPMGAFDAEGKGTRAIAAMRPSAVGGAQATHKTPSQPTAKTPATPAGSAPVQEPEKKGGSPVVWIIVVLVVVAAVAYVLLKR